MRDPITDRLEFLAHGDRDLFYPPVCVKILSQARGDKVLSADTIRAVGLAERIQWILENRIDPATKAPWDAKALSVAANLGSDAHVGMMKRGTVKKPTGETLAAIAKVANVSLWWLTIGEGSPDVDDDARAPSTRESETAVRGNVIGWDDAKAIVQARRKWSEEQWGVAERIAALTTRGIISPEEVEEIMRLVEKHSDPRRMERQLAEAYERQRQVLADAETRETEAIARQRAEREAAQAAPAPKPKGRPRKPTTGK